MEDDKQMRAQLFTPEEYDLINRAMRVHHGMKIYKAVFYHDAVIEKAQRMLAEAEANNG